MLDPKFIRENPELVKENIRKKFQDKEKIVDEFIKRFDEWRAIKQEGDKLRQRRNTISKEVSEAKKKKDEKLASKLIEESKKNLENIEANEKLAEDTWIKVRELQEKIPNIISKDVPIGKDDSENVVEETFGNPKKPNFEIVNHAELIENLGMGDFDSSARVAGKGFYYISGDIALLNQALIQYAIKTMVKKGFTYVETPLMLRGRYY
jgi:seryl-tRNA synthetase